MLSFIAPARGQTSGGSSIASLTVLSSDTAKVLERRVYDNGLGDVVQEVQSWPGSSLPSLVVHHECDGTSAPTGGYAVHNLTLVQQTLHSAAYYDDYAFIGHHGVPSSLAASAVPGYPIDASLGRGMQTGSATAVLSDGGVAGYTYSAMYYDSRHRVSRLSPTTYGFTAYHYNKDHLGNNREVVGPGGSVQQVTNYYPFGAPYADPSAVTGAYLQPYKYNFSIEREKRKPACSSEREKNRPEVNFSIKREKRKVACSSEREKNRPKVNGKELDTMHGLDTYDYGARQYYPILGRWDRMDPLCEKYYDLNTTFLNTWATRITPVMMLPYWS